MRRVAGFTLLEMLVAILLTGIVMIFAYQSFQQITRTQNRARTDRDRDLVASVFLDRFERELLGTLLMPLPEETDRLTYPWLFFGEDRVFGTNDSDGLRFITQSPARMPGSTAPGLRMVSYAVADGGDIERFDLYRHEEDLPENLQKEISVLDGQPVLEDVLRFSLRYRDEETGEYHDVWDSTDLATVDLLPAAVEVALQLYEESETGEMVPGEEHRRDIVLPVRPINPGDEELEDDEETGCEGDTIAECLEFYEFEIDESGQRTQIMEAAAAAGTGCWYQEEPTTELEALWAALELIEEIDDGQEACP